MSILAAQEVEQSAKRRVWEFWKRSVEQSFDPEVGLKDIDVVRGVTDLGDGEREVVFRYSAFGCYAGGVSFSGYPMLRTFEAKTTLEKIAANTQWLTSKEFSDLGKAP